MSIAHKRFALGFAGATVVVALLNLAPFIWTFRAYQGDGFELIGFPFTFRRLGGEYPNIYEFHVVALWADIGLGLALALLAGYTFARFRRGS
jgi:hypothetical protein